MVPLRGTVKESLSEEPAEDQRAPLVAQRKTRRDSPEPWEEGGWCMVGWSMSQLSVVVEEYGTRECKSDEEKRSDEIMRRNWRRFWERGIKLHDRRRLVE
jgi:hypothetical protein